MKTRILIADDHAIVRDGVRALLAAAAEFEIVGEASTGLEAIDLAVALEPDIVLMDIAMPGLGGLEATVEIRRRVPRVKVIVLSQYGEPEYVRMLEAIDSYLDRGYSVVYSTKDTQPSGSKVRPDHVVLVDRVIRDRRGVTTGVVLRDQYKTDDPDVRDGNNDGYVTLTSAQAAAWMEGVMWCRV